MNYSYYGMIALIAALVIWRRSRSMVRPIKGTGLRLLIPLIFLVPGLALLFGGKAHAPGWEWAAALAIGGLLSLPLIWTTNYEIREDNRIYAKKNVGFIVSIVAVLLIRLILRDSLPSDQETAAALFLTLAMGYLLPWRIVSYVKFRKVFGSLRQDPAARL